MSNKKRYDNIIYRADGNTKIGLGHVYRLIALNQMVEGAAERIFISDDTCYKHVDNILPQKEFTKHLSTKSEEQEQLKLILELKRVNTLVVLDGYHFSSDFEQKLIDHGVSVLTIDDLHEREFHADLILNPALNVSARDYTLTRGKLLSGFDHILLRREFFQQKGIIEEDEGETTCLICFGGSDFHNLTQKVIKPVLQHPSVAHTHVIIGSAYAHLDSLKNINGVNIHSDLSAKEMKSLMLQSNICIAPASGICNELISLNRVIITGYYTNNQLDILNGLTDAGAVINAENLLETTNEKLTQHIDNALNPEIRQQLINNQRELFDGLSPSRINRAILDIIN